MSNRIDPFDSSALRQNLRSKAVRGSFVTVGSQGAMFVLQFAGNVLMARLLSPDEFGLIAMVTAITGFLDIFRDLGLSTATIQKTDIQREQVGVFFWINTGAGAAMALLTILFSPLIAWFYGRPELTGISCAMAAAFLLSGLSAQHHALLRRTMQFGRIAAIDIAALCIGLGAGVWAALAGWSYWSLVVQRVMRSLVTAVLFWVSMRWNPGWFRWDPAVKPMLRFGSYLAATNIMNYASRNVDNVAIGWYWGAAQLGIYSRAYNLLMMPIQQVGGPISNVALPALSRLQDDKEKFRQAYLTLMHAAGMALIPGVAALMACADALIVLLLGDRWLEVVAIYRWLGFAALVQPMTVTCGLLFLCSGRSKDLSRSTLINSVLSVLSIVVALPWGPAAVAGSYAASGLLVRTPILLYFAGRLGYVTQRDMYAVIVPELLSGGLIFAGGWYLGNLLAPGLLVARIAIAAGVALLVAGLHLAVSAKQRARVRDVRALFLKKKPTPATTAPA